MNQKKFGIDEAVQFVLEPGSESELSELGESDFEENNDITTEVLHWIHKVNRKEEEETEEKEREVIINNEQNSVPLESKNECKKGKAFSMPPDDVDIFTPLNYFQFFGKLFA